MGKAENWFLSASILAKSTLLHTKSSCPLCASITELSSVTISANAVALVSKASKRYKTIAEDLIFSNVRSTPLASIISCVSRIPAVSINLKLMPLIFISSSMVSRVVPAISDTMALSSFNKTFNKVDLPTFGFPAITTGTPFLITLPNSKDCISLLITLKIAITKDFNCSLLANSTSSSEKSNSNSIIEAK